MEKISDNPLLNISLLDDDLYNDDRIWGFPDKKVGI